MLYSGKNLIASEQKSVKGQFIDINGEKFYEIDNYDNMQPFFISLASDTDLWMYLASTGGLTAGRKSPEQALFPYYTDDKITEQYEQTGPKTIVRVKDESGKSYLWEPFSERQAGVYDIERKISKSTVGNKIVFCEENHDLELRFSYIWESADRFGWVRRATIENLGAKQVEVELLDGLQNVLPAGVERLTQNTYSTLVDGYKKTELVGNIVLFRMEAILVDRAEPSESLRCNTIMCLGLDKAEYLVSSRQLDAFRRGRAVVAEAESKGVRGAIFAHTEFVLTANGTEPSSKTWYFVADVDKDAVAVRDLMQFAQRQDATEQIEEAVDKSTRTLIDIVGQNDGVQHTADENNDARHFANTLFNTMRGGFYVDDYNIDGAAFKHHINIFNKPLAKKYDELLSSLPQTISYFELQKQIAELGDKQMERLLLEYLPITFGRRHGDPSRPWNLFSIRVNDENGKRVISYQGNWRDIFQNWEALSLSYPRFINGIIAKFLNATTADGYNPYKVTSEGIDWEVIEPDNPWSNIGYWGDHQIIYLLKLLELSFNHDPKALQELLNKQEFAFANVPYKLKSYNEIVADPKNSINFDDDLHKHIFELIPTYGQDARLVLDNSNEVVLTTCIDKLLITLLAKMSNFVPDAGIWMNTLRPEWNDANNALVGFGASMVTLYYMRRYVSFLKKLTAANGQDIKLSATTAELLSKVAAAVEQMNHSEHNPHTRREFIDAVGTAAEAYRSAVYACKFGDAVVVTLSELQDFFANSLSLMDKAIAVNKRADGLYNAYNLVSFSGEGATKQVEIEYLYEMLEGQVAVLTSGALSGEQSVELLDRMRESALYRADQRSYMLYPARRRKTFLELNDIPDEAKQLPIVKQLLEKADGKIIKEDREGHLHFNGGFNNADFLARAAKKEGISEADIDTLCKLYEQVFNHKAFTGRSGTFYKYEGLGCIYWHMVSKLLLAVGETISRVAADEASAKATTERLIAQYAAIREGIGSHKSPEEYGSFPFDAYSHTPQMAGVQQPGMTGQVKEDIISRFFELGLSVEDGELKINPFMLTAADFADGELRFSYCNTPFIFRQSGKKAVGVELAEGAKAEDKELASKIDSNVLPRELASHLFDRDGVIKAVVVEI